MYISKKTMVYYIGLLFAFFGLSIITYLVVEDGLHLMLGWNLFLAFIPFILVYILDRRKIKSKAINIILLLMWLFLFPNSIYVMTDLIYINYSDFMINGGPYSDLLYLQNLEAYLALFHIIIGLIIGLIYGLKSIDTLYKYCKESNFSKYKDLLVVGVFSLSSVGIYIGRFFRYNSWDIIKVWNIISDFFSTLSWFTVFFIFFMTVIQLLLFYSIRKIQTKKSN
ncbi:DUF1361 domain-containing protein [Mycoplasmatota bacterium WC30]